MSVLKGRICILLERWPCSSSWPVRTFWMPLCFREKQRPVIRNRHPTSSLSPWQAACVLMPVHARLLACHIRSSRACNPLSRPEHLCERPSAAILNLLNKALILCQVMSLQDQNAALAEMMLRWKACPWVYAPALLPAELARCCQRRRTAALCRRHVELGCARGVIRSHTWARRVLLAGGSSEYF